MIKVTLNMSATDGHEHKIKRTVPSMQHAVKMCTRANRMSAGFAPFVVTAVIQDLKNFEFLDVLTNVNTFLKFSTHTHNNRHVA